MSANSSLNIPAKDYDILKYLGEGFDADQKQSIEQTLQILQPFIGVKHDMPQGTDVALIVKKLNVDLETITATILTDPRLIEQLDLKAVNSRFGEKVATLIENTNRLNTFNEYSEQILDSPDQVETLRRMLFAMVNDVRAVIIKLAYRIQRLREIQSEPPEVKQFVAKETLNVYAPLANRMGIAQFKWELEDLAFRCLHPEVYRKISQTLSENRSNREDYLEKFVRILEEILKKGNIDAEVYGRPKHIYSIWRKMQQKHLQFNELFDIRAVRITTEKISVCYEILGLIHGQWSYIPKEFDDYIANPKSNGYQSLHTVIIGPEDKLVEIQIRTQTMHEFAELGVAAHWRYKEGGKQDVAAEKTISSIRNILANKNNDGSLLENFQTELYADRIFVLTPKGQLKDLAKGATPLDFAYSVHTEIGHRCRGAKVDGQIVPLTYELQSGQRVEILTAKQGGPNRSWIDPKLGYIKSLHAINKVKAWFKQQNHEQNIQDGKTILEQNRQKLKLDSVDLDYLAKYFHLNRPEDFFIQLGRGDISLLQLTGALQIPEDTGQQLRIKSKPANKLENKDHVSVRGVGNILTHISHCCNPVPGDSIIGYITQGKGVAIHRQECSNLLHLDHDQKDRLIDVTWGKDADFFPVQIFIQAYDRKELLKDITQTLSVTQAHILDIKTHNDRKNLTISMELTIEVQHTGHLNDILNKLGQLQNVIGATRL